MRDGRVGAREVVGGVGHSFDRPIPEAPPFYTPDPGMAFVACVVVPILDMPLPPVTLNATLSATVPMPPVLLFVLPMARDPASMGARVDACGANVFG